MKMLVLPGRNGRHGVSVAQHAAGELVKGKECANSLMERMYRQLNVVERIRKRRHAMKINALVSTEFYVQKKNMFNHYLLIQSRGPIIYLQLHLKWISVNTMDVLHI